ncbi:hypothetical protein [Streptomyces purpureus]|uniref:Lipoprotein n=1 Tax=Streptomyces purpureus TaxID=1951 RepID=A0A918GWF3_9ACTN|nr:hypothetical protein [Streptomyces purpureus]GGT13283.1 lipoprotein [Streptomyces purpureus]
MRAIRAATAALLGAAALALTAPVPAAVAADTAKAPGDFALSPSTVAPGGRVTLSAPGCRSTATAASGVFDTATIPPGSSTTATVDWDARRGAVYTVSFVCSGGPTGTLDLRIAGGANVTPTISSTALTSPRGVQGGLGGSSSGMAAGTIAAGSALVVAAAGGLFWTLRRRAARRH